jgi:hypothetical protein
MMAAFDEKEQRRRHDSAFVHAPDQVDGLNTFIISVLCFLQEEWKDAAAQL